MSVEGAMAAAGNFFGLTPKGDAPAPESSAGPARAAAGGAPESSSGSDAAAADSPACRPERTSQQTRFSSALPPPAEGVATGQKPAEGKEGRIMRMAGGLANAIGLGRSSCNRNSAANERASKTGQGERSSVRSRLGYDATRKRITRAAEMRTTMLSRQQNTYSYAQKRQMQKAAKGLLSSKNFRSRRFSSTSLADASRHDSYKFDGEESKIHFDRRSALPENHRYKVQVVTTTIVVTIAISLGLIAAGMNVAVHQLHLRVHDLTTRVMWQPGSSEPHTGEAYAVFVGSNGLIILAAAMLVHFAPAAANSGLPKLKSYLNGTFLRGGVLSARTLICKTLGITLVVASGLPLGKEGPMVHIGAMIAAILSRYPYPGTGQMLELRLPQPQREWIGMGAAAGVAAAFNAPFGGILYSFEEVCSHWSHALTWRSFFCCMLVAMTYRLIVEMSDGELASGFATGLSFNNIPDLFYSGAVGWIILLGAAGGALGAAYNIMVIYVNKFRMRLFLTAGGERRQSFDAESPAGRGGSCALSGVSAPSPPRARKGSIGAIETKRFKLVKALQVTEAVAVACLIFTMYFFIPVALPCTPCPNGTAPDSSSSSGEGRMLTGSRMLAGSRMQRMLASTEHDDDAGGCVFTGHRPHVRHTCPEGEYSELGTLLLSGQEGMLNHLLSRHTRETWSGEIEDVEHFSITTLTILLCFYFVIASFSFGIHLPAGNFVPGIAMGATLGRLFGQVLTGANLDVGWHPGAYALLGAAAVLSGMTRMTLTLAAILVEVVDDIHQMPAIMLTLSVANMVAEKISPSFDEAMMKLQGLPFLHESPPSRLSMLTAHNAMASPVIVLPEVAQIGFLVGLLDNTTHNGFPVVRADVKGAGLVQASKTGRLEPGPGMPVDDQQTVLTTKAKFCGMILRRQLLVLLKERVWEYQLSDKDIPPAVVERFVGSFAALADKDVGGKDQDLPVGGKSGPQGIADFCKLRKDDLDKLLDLRSFMDPSPLTVGRLMPLSRVYRLFNEIGVRHLPVIDNQSCVSGIITRKDLHIESMENTIMRLADMTENNHPCIRARGRPSVCAKRNSKGELENCLAGLSMPAAGRGRVDSHEGGSDEGGSSFKRGDPANGGAQGSPEGGSPSQSFKNRCAMLQAERACPRESEYVRDSQGDDDDDTDDTGRSDTGKGLFKKTFKDRFCRRSSSSNASYQTSGSYHGNEVHPSCARQMRAASGAGEPASVEERLSHQAGLCAPGRGRDSQDLGGFSGNPSFSKDHNPLAA